MNNPISSAHLERWIDGSLSSSSSPAQQRIDSDAPNPNPGLPPWVLLDQVAYIDYDGRENATTAKAGTIFGTVKVTFFAAEPPHLSHFSVHCSGLTKLDFMGKPRIHMSVDNMALISVSFACGFTTEYFFYRCGHGRRPTLEHLKLIGDYLKKVPLVASIGFLPRGHGGEDFLLAALAFTNSADNYQLHVFRPEDHVWTNKAICLGKHYSIRNIEKVMTIENNVAFVDLWKGILICNVLVENPTVRFILFPPLLAGNQEKDQMSSGRLIRDVMYSNGLLRCVEIEHVIKETSQKNTKTEPQDLLKLEVFYDRDLMQDKKVTKEENFLLYDGWRVLTRSRTLSSSVCWFRDEGFSVNDINSAPYTRLLSDLGGSGCTLKDLFVAAPTLTMGWTDYLYILSMVRTRSQNCCVIVVDLVQRRLEGLIPIPTQKANFFCPTYVPSSLTKYLSMDSDETCIDEQNELDSSDYQEYEETVDVSAEAIRNNYPPAQLYSDYSTLTTSSDIFPHSHQRQQSPVEVAHSSWQRSLSSSGESQIGSGNRSWSTSSPQPINESGGSCATSSARYPWSAQYRDSSPITPTSLAPCYHQHQELGHLSGSLPRSSPQMTEESIRSCITTSGHNSGVQFSLDSSPVTPSGAFTFYANHHHHQQPPREAACPLWQSSQPSRSYSSTHQMTEESIRSCITSTSGHSSGVQFSLDSSPVTPSGAFTFCANHNHHHHHQPPREVACPLWQSSQPSRSSSSTHQEKLGQNYDGYYHSSIIPSESRYCQQPSPLSWYSSPSLQKQQLQSGACLFQSASHLSSSRFAAWKPSRHL